MGGQDSKCSRLLEGMGWAMPTLSDDFYLPALVSYLDAQNLEVTLPRHAPQCDMSIGSRKGKMYPRPNFCWEGCKMHLALVGPSSDCKKQFTDFLPKIASTFRGPPSRLGPGREAIPHYFFDSELHKMVLWELPEVMFKQHCEDYIRELGLLYIDCVFMLFSDRYPLTDIYCKLCVAMAVHGIPFFVVCTQTQRDAEGKISEQLAKKITSEFRKKDILVRMLNPDDPGATVTKLMSDFFKEVSWNRTERDPEKTQGLDPDVLGQTVRLQGLEKKPELNGRCGVCVGRDSEQGRYLVRLIEGGVEADVALKEASLSVLKLRLRGEVVRIKGLESKPELNGRLAFADEFLRETERYRVFIPDMPNTAFVLALKPANLEKADDVRGARPVDGPAPSPAAARASAQPAGAAPKASGAAGRPVAAPRGAAPRAAPPKGAAPAGDFLPEPAGQHRHLAADAAAAQPLSPGSRPEGRPSAADGCRQEEASARVGVATLASTERSRGAAAAAAQPLSPGSRPEGRPSAADGRRLAEPSAQVGAAAPASTERPRGAAAAAAQPLSPASWPEGRPSAADGRRLAEPSAQVGAAAPASMKRPRGAATAGHDEDLDELLPKREQPSTDDDGLDLMSRILAADRDTTAAAQMPAAAPVAPAAPAAAGAASVSMDDDGLDLMSRILAADRDGPAAAQTPAAAPAAPAAPAAAGAASAAEAPPKEPPPVPPLQLTLQGLFSLRVWAVVGDPDAAEEIIDNLMDCGKTVFTVSSGGGAYFPSVGELGRDPALPATEVLALVRDEAGFDHVAAAADAVRLRLHGVLLHPSAAAFRPGLAQSYRAAGLAVFEADLLADLEPGLGIDAAPLD